MRYKEPQVILPKQEKQKHMTCLFGWLTAVRMNGIGTSLKRRTNCSRIQKQEMTVTSHTFAHS